MTTFLRKTRKLLAVLATLVGVASPAFAQQSVTQTTLGAAVAVGDRIVAVASATGIAIGSEIFVDQEAMNVLSVSSLNLSVQRGVDGTAQVAHPNGAIVYAGPSAALASSPEASGFPGTPFVFQDPALGSCTLTSEPWALRINVVNGKIWQCTNSIWMNVVDAIEFVGPGNCFFSTTGGTLATPAAVTNINVYATTSTGMINAGATAPGTPVMQVATTNSGTATNTISCLVSVPSRAHASKGVYLVDATWLYGVQQNALGTQAVTLASGLMNGVLAFGKIVLPAAAASETPSTVAQARADAGTMVLTPVAASFNTAVTTAGAFATEKIAPANPIALTTDLTAYYVNITVLCQATTATTFNVGGVLLHFRYVVGL